MKKLTRGTDKHKGKLPFKCFNFGQIGHFDSKFPYAKSENEEKGISAKKGKGKKFQKGNIFGIKKKVFYSKEDNTLDE
jgi:hypothetical protein